MDERIKLFEMGASKKGYDMTRDDLGRYVDIFLQEAWEIFQLMNEPSPSTQG